MKTLTQSVVVSASDLVHHDDDTIDLHITVRVSEANNSKPKTLLWAVIRSDFWSNPRIHERYITLLEGDLDDIELLLIALFEELGHDLRRYGTDLGERIYLTPEALLALLARDVAQRLHAPVAQLFANTFQDSMNHRC